MEMPLKIRNNLTSYSIKLSLVKKGEPEKSKGRENKARTAYQKRVKR